MSLLCKKNEKKKGDRALELTRTRRMEVVGLRRRRYRLLRETSSSSSMVALKWEGDNGGVGVVLLLAWICNGLGCVRRGWGGVGQTRERREEKGRGILCIYRELRSQNATF